MTLEFTIISGRIFSRHFKDKSKGFVHIYLNDLSFFKPVAFVDVPVGVRVRFRDVTFSIIV